MIASIDVAASSPLYVMQHSMEFLAALTLSEMARLVPLVDQPIKSSDPAPDALKSTVDAYCAAIENFLRDRDDPLSISEDCMNSIISKCSVGWSKMPMIQFRNMGSEVHNPYPTW